jgi:hypothetical protein
VCGHCGCADAQQFTRDGHYRRSLQTGWGSIEELRVPMLEWKPCGHDVICHFTILEKYERFWFAFASAPNAHHAGAGGDPI